MTLITDRWQTVRIAICAVLLTGALIETGRALLRPTVVKDTAAANTANSVKFPPSIPLSNWQLSTNKSLKPSPGQGLGHLYQYRNHNNEKVDIQVHDEKYTEGNIGRLLMVYDIAPPASALLTTKYQYNSGFYALTSYNNRAYLSACINPIGQSTATQQQFTQNKYQYGLNFVRTLGWLAGVNDLIDASCLWTLISTPLPADVDEQLLTKKYETLEAIWAEWYDWWNLNLKKSEKK
jgi:cyanosortase A-associated protein